MTIEDLVRYACDQRASDIFAKAGSHPAFRVGGHIQFVDALPVLSAEGMSSLARELLSDGQWNALQDRREVDAGVQFEGLTRVRANVFWTSGTIAMVLRLVPLDIKPLEELYLPAKVSEFATYNDGVVLVTGPTGSGKSTTLAAIIDLINANRRASIITIEDPIEFVHRNKQSIVIQREVGTDTKSFSDGMKYSLRQNPDVILIGEMRDKETVGVALSAAETGHLVLSTLHTTSAAETLERIVGMFPADEHVLLCERLSYSLRAICAQKLIPSLYGQRVPAVELMVTNAYVAKLIRENRCGDIYQRIEDGLHDGMQTMEQSLAGLYQAGWITQEEAMRNAGNALALRALIRDLDRQQQMGRERTD